MSLSQKNIVLICPKFYGYEDYIANDLRDKGATVYLIYENLEWVKLSYRFIYVYFPNRKDKLHKKYYKMKLNKIIHELDYFIVVRGSSINPEIMKWVKNEIPKSCRSIMYQWDGVKNNQSILEVSSYFDRVLTFDIEDSIKYRWIYRPLFYLPQYVDKSVQKDIDVLFICALHSNRAKVLNEVKAITNERSYKLKTVLYLNRFLFYKYKYLNKKDEVIYAFNKDMTFKPLHIKESYELYSRSKVVVDYTNTNQTGFTMRTIEALGCGCKLITNNQHIKNADFYNENNIHIYDEDMFTFPNDFLDSSFMPILENVYNSYSLNSWVNDIIGENNEQN